MSKLRVQVSPITNTIYAGSLIQHGQLYGANKTDVTSDVIGAIIQYVGDDKTKKCGQMALSHMRLALKR